MPNSSTPKVPRVEALNQSFGISCGDQREFFFENGPGGLLIARISNAQATAAIALQGAHLLEWTPQGEYPVIWLSRGAKFAPGKSIRGGVPICWPWFGAHETQPEFPAHGFARTAQWQVAAASSLDDGSTQLRFILSETDKHLWPCATPVEYRVTVGKQLQLELLTRNDSNETVRISQALHTYFSIDDINSIQVDGLDGCDYLDKVDDFARKQQVGPVQFSSEVDRIYLGAPGDCVIRDPGLGRNIRISKEGSSSTVVWNPWEEKSRQMEDMGAHGYKTMVCVESANAADDVVEIVPGGEHSLKVRYDVEPYE